MPVMTHPDSNKLGRIKSPFDPRDHLHLVGASFRIDHPEAKVSRRTSRRWSPGTGHAWDQGNTPRCVGYGTNRFLVSSPIRNPVYGHPKRTDYNPPNDNDSRLTEFHKDILNFYRAAQAGDGMPMPHDGTTVRAAMDVLLYAGLIQEYQWALNASDAARHVLNVGPMVIGIDWTTPMFDPFPFQNNPLGGQKRWIKVLSDDGTYDVQGGHCLLWIAVDLNEKCPDGSTGSAALFNSWGPLWGDNGEVKISLKDLGILGANQAEFARAVELPDKSKSVAAAASV